MAITIDGNANTIAGLAVGGLPDGVIDADSLATDAISNVKIANDAIGLNELSATGTASSSTYLRGDNTWATLPGGGKVLQMIQTTKKDVESFTVNQNTYQDMDFVASITPSAATSKIRFQAVLQTALSSTHFYGIQVYRSINGGAAAALTGYQGDTNGSRTEISQANSANPNTQFRIMAMDYIDDISSWTSGAISYSIYGFHGEHASSKVMYLNRGGADSDHQQTPSPMSTITLTEISA